MRKLYGRVETEKIIFGREIYGLRRRRMACAIVCAAVAIVIVTVMIFALSRDGDTDGNTPPVTEMTDVGDAVEEHSSRSDQAEISSETVSEESPTEEETTDSEEPIIYKDFSDSEIEIINNTGWSISFINSNSNELVKYYDKSSKKPICLILHTYTQDRYSDSQGRYVVCAVGQVIADELNSMGIGTIYCSAVHDADANEPSKNVAETIEFYLKMYPSIKYIFDVGIAEEYEGDKTVATSGSYMGSRAAQIKILAHGNNLSTGRENLRLAYEISKNLRLGDMTVGREICYNNSISNSIYTPYFLEIFVGSTGNTEGEGKLSARVFASAFAQILV